MIIAEYEDQLIIVRGNWLTVHSYGLVNIRTMNEEEVYARYGVNMHQLSSLHAVTFRTIEGEVEVERIISTTKIGELDERL